MPVHVVRRTFQAWAIPDFIACCGYLGVSMAMGVPHSCLWWNIPLKWMMTGGTPISGNHHSPFFFGGNYLMFAFSLVIWHWKIYETWPCSIMFHSQVLDYPRVLTLVSNWAFSTSMVIPKPPKNPLLRWQRNNDYGLFSITGTLRPQLGLDVGLVFGVVFWGKSSPETTVVFLIKCSFFFL